jgi:hypothetical protein
LRPAAAKEAELRNDSITVVERIRPASRRVRRARARSLLGTLAIATIGFFVLLCIGLLAPILWTVILEGGESKPRACDTIKNAAERVACFEAQRDGSAQPARGAIAPRSAVPRADD